MPTLWQWSLDTDGTPDRRAVHALLSEWLDTDHHTSSKPWSWSPADAGGIPALWIGLVDDTLVERLLDRSAAYHRSKQRRDAPPLTQPLRQVAATTWAQLAAARPEHSGRWRLRFATPVTFRRGDRFMPWPAPAPVFGSLRTTWRTHAAPHVGDLCLDLSLDPLVVTGIDGASHTERVPLRKPNGNRTDRRPVEVTVNGFLGTITYTADGPLDTAAVESLTRLAPYCGVGSYTTRGFGAVRTPTRP